MGAPPAPLKRLCLAKLATQASELFYHPIGVSGTTVDKHSYQFQEIHIMGICFTVNFNLVGSDSYECPMKLKFTVDYVISHSESVQSFLLQDFLDYYDTMKDMFDAMNQIYDGLDHIYESEPDSDYDF